MDYYNNPFLPQTPVGFNPAPRQTITRVNGRESVNSLRMTPNSELLALDNTAPILWVCVSDGVGMVNAKAYDIVEHKERTPESSLEGRVTALEKAIINLTGGMKNEPGNPTVERGETSADA